MLLLYGGVAATDCTPCPRRSCAAEIDSEAEAEEEEEAGRRVESGLVEKGRSKSMTKLMRRLRYSRREDLDLGIFGTGNCNSEWF